MASKATSCRDAIKAWEQKTGMIANESKDVKLSCQIPSIDKMDDSLNSLEMCEKLSLCSNEIERIISLPKLRRIKVLSLGRNNIKRLQGLEDIGNSLEELWINYNNVEKLDGIQHCTKLIVFFASHNRIKSWDEVAKLAVLSELKAVLLIGNAIYGDRDPMDNHPTLVKRVP